MARIECSVWNNGGAAWGLKVLGGLRVRKLYFHPARSPVFLELGGALSPINVKKKSFWTEDCGELISVELREWIMKKGLATGDRVWLEIVEPYHRFKAVVVQVALPVNEIAS